MKSINTYTFKVLALGLLLTLSYVYSAKTNMQTKVKQYQANSDLKELVKKLFSQPQCPPNMRNKNLEHKPPLNQNVGTNGIWAIPRNKPNKYDARLYGWGPSAYLFDYLDPILEGHVLKIFNDLWTEVSTKTTFATKEERDDPYTLKRIFNMPDQTDEVLLEKFKALKPSFNKAVWEASVTVPQVRAAAKSWNYNANSNDYALEIVNTYDYNGDGRLSRKEYIIAYLNINRATIGTKQCTTFEGAKKGEKLENECIHSFAKNILYPMFFRADCGDYDDKIGSEEIWYAFKSLIRKHNDKDEKRWNIYECIILNEPYHTVSINDFILKSMKTIDSYLNKLEFTRGIFLAYWARSVDDLTIFPTYYEEEKKQNPIYHNMKNLRWSRDSPYDNKCLLLKN